MLQRIETSARGARAAALAATLIAALTASCGGGGSPSPSPGPTTPPQGGATPTPTPTPEPPTSASCALGNGNYLAQCDRESPQLLQDMEHAIDAVIEAHPELFDLTQTTAPGSFLVLDGDAYQDAVVDTLRRGGFCSERADNFVKLKNTNDFSESYDVLLSTGFIRRGDNSYRETCHPASFPVDPRDVIHDVRVSFYEIRCPGSDREPPGTNEDLLPVGCIGQVTATPKDINGNNVPPEIHGPDIDWSLEQNGPYVRLDDVEHQEFNKTLTGLDPGEFALCATVQGVQGCLRGEVVP